MLYKKPNEDGTFQYIETEDSLTKEYIPATREEWLERLDNVEEKLAIKVFVDKPNMDQRITQLEERIAKLEQKLDNKLIGE